MMSKRIQEVYISTDVETDGPIPGPHSMLSFGSAVFRENGEMIDTFSANLETLEGARGDPKTMEWWKTQPQAWEECRKEPLPPVEVMPEYVSWVRYQRGRPVFVAYPAGFDFLFMYWYMIRFAGECPFSFSALDIKTFAMAMLGTPYRETSKRRFPKKWFGDRPHTHRALDDAIEQGEMFMRMLNDARQSWVLRGGS